MTPVLTVGPETQMPLLGAPLLIALGALAILAPLATALLWSRLRGPRAVRALSRAGLLLTTQLTAVLLVAAALNNYGDFYATWSELLGTAGTPTAPIVAVGGGTAGGGAPGQASGRAPGATAGASGAGGLRITGAAAADARGGLLDLGQFGHTSPALFAKLGEVRHVYLVGRRSGLAEDAYVYLPPQYFQSAYRFEHFPAAEVFTGYPGDALALPAKLHYPQIERSLVAAHKTNPFVLVMLRPAVAFPHDSECYNVPHGPQSETYFSHDVVYDIADHYRVMPYAWGAMGDSTGGWCSFWLSFSHPDQFVAAVSMSGYFHPLQDFTTGDLFGGNPTLEKRENPESLMADGTVPNIAVLATVGRDEGGPYGYADLLRLEQLRRPPLQLDTLVLPNSGHNLQAWQAQLPADLGWLGQHIAGAFNNRPGATYATPSTASTRSTSASAS
ncbi:MAG: alpha/beta hydrolase [Actinomycetales bacterium]